MCYRQLFLRRRHDKVSAIVTSVTYMVRVTALSASANIPSNIVVCTDYIRLFARRDTIDDRQGRKKGKRTEYMSKYKCEHTKLYEFEEK